MRRNTHIFFLLAVLVVLAVSAFVYYSNRKSVKNTSEPVSYLSFEAGWADSGGLDSASLSMQDNREQNRLSSNITLEADETLLDLYSYNLDYDDDEEQVLVTRRASDESGALRIVVADYSPTARRWYRAWEGVTAISQIKTLQVTAIDLIGDHNINLICTGMNKLGEQSMTVFWKTDSNDNRQPGPGFMKIFEDSGNSITIESDERSESYKMGQTNAESWAIIVHKPDPFSDNFLDQIKETWAWDFAEKHYLLVNNEQIPGASIARKLTDSILDGSAETFENWLEGIWFQEGIDPLSPDALFITFEPRGRAVLFSRNQITETYNWETSNSTRMGLYISSTNRSVSNLRRYVELELESADSIKLRVFQAIKIKADTTDRWDGTYRKLSAEAAKVFRKQPSQAWLSAPSAESLASGLYIGQKAERLYLNNQKYEYTSQEGTETGGWAVYSILDNTFLDLRAITIDGISATRRRSFMILPGDDESRSIRLREVNIRFDGFEFKDDLEFVLTYQSDEKS